MAWTLERSVSVGVILTLATFVAGLGYTVTHRIPDLDAKIDHYSSEQQTREDKWEAEQRSRLDAMDSRLIALSTNVLRLCSRNGNPDRNCKIDALVSTATDIVGIQTRQLAAARIKQPSGTKPDVDPVTDKVLADLQQFPSEPTVTMPSKVAAAATWATVAKDSKWYVQDGKLNVSYSNGSAAFVPAAGVTQLFLKQAAVNLNNLSAAVRDATSNNDSNNPPQASPSNGQHPE